MFDFNLIAMRCFFAYDSFGNVLIEEMAAGLPVLASNVDGPAKILTQGKYG